MTSNNLFSYCTKEDVIQLSGAKLDTLGYDKSKEDSQSKFNKQIEDWINLSSSTINDYCNTKWEEDIPQTIKLACMMMVSNLIAFTQLRRDQPIIKKDDWNMDYIKADYFNKEIKELLEPYKNETVDGKASIGFFTISGD